MTDTALKFALKTYPDTTQIGVDKMEYTTTIKLDPTLAEMNSYEIINMLTVRLKASGMLSLYLPDAEDQLDCSDEVDSLIFDHCQELPLTDMLNCMASLSDEQSEDALKACKSNEHLEICEDFQDLTYWMYKEAIISLVYSELKSDGWKVS